MYFEAKQKGLEVERLQTSYRIKKDSLKTRVKPVFIIKDPYTIGLSSSWKSSVKIQSKVSMRQEVKKTAVPPQNLNVNKIKADLETLVRKNSHELRLCYQQSYSRRGLKGGFVNLSLLITQQGSVRSIQVLKSNLSDSKFLECVFSRIKQWKFKKGYQIQIEQMLQFETF